MEVSCVMVKRSSNAELVIVEEELKRHGAVDKRMLRLRVVSSGVGGGGGSNWKVLAVGIIHAATPF